MNYKQHLLKHLADYKRVHLRVTTPGIYRSRSYDHLLPAEDEWRNILELKQVVMRRYLDQNRIKRHPRFHRLNSSQAFAFNLFVPYFAGEPSDASILLRALGQDGVLADWEPEFVWRRAAASERS